MVKNDSKNNNHNEYIQPNLDIFITLQVAENEPKVTSSGLPTIRNIPEVKMGQSTVRSGNDLRRSVRGRKGHSNFLRL